MEINEITLREGKGLKASRKNEKHQVYDKIDFMREIDKCAKNGDDKAISSLVGAGVDINKLNGFHFKAPMHFAAEGGHLNVIQTLVDIGANINIQDCNGSTPLHYLVKKNEQIRLQECLQYLLSRKNLNLNIPNKEGYTPIHAAASKGNEDAVRKILGLENSQRSVLDLDSYSVDNKTAREVIVEKYPDLERVLPSAQRDEVIAQHVLFQLIRRRDTEFVKKFKKMMMNETLNLKDLLRTTNGNFTLLQYACRKRFVEAVEILLGSGADVNLASINPMPPVNIACLNGDLKILRLLVKKNPAFNPDEKGETALHAVAMGSASGDHSGCLKELLGLNKLDIDQQDNVGNTPLHYAVNYEKEDCVFCLLDEGADAGVKNQLQETPLANMRESTLKKYLDMSVSTRKDFPGEKSYAWVVDYKFLIPHHLRKSKSKKTPNGSETKYVLNDEDAHPVPISDLLLQISQSPLRQLLTHPVLRIFVILKWRQMEKPYFVNLLFYTLFCFSLSAHVIFGVTRVLLMTFLMCFMLRELFQLFINPRMYVKSAENWLEIVLIAVSCFVVVNDCGQEVSFSSSFCPQFSAVAILVSWFELFLLVGKHPRLSSRIEMFNTVCFTFLKFLTWYTILIIAFALSFFTLFRGCTECSDTNPFTNPGVSIFKTIIMMTGEFDSGGIPFGSFVGTSHVLFVIFVFLIAIVLLNLLNGLAVSDTQAIREDASLSGITAEVSLISEMEHLTLGHQSIFKKLLKLLIDRFFSHILVFTQKIKVFPKMKYEVIFSGKNGEKKKGNRFFLPCYKVQAIVRGMEVILGQRHEENSENKDGLKDLCQRNIKALEKLEERLKALEISNKEILSILGYVEPNSSLNLRETLKL